MYRSNLRLVFGVVIAFIITVFVVSVAQAAKPDCANLSHPSCKDDGSSSTPAIVANNKGSIVVMNDDGSSNIVIDDAGTSWAGPAWSPDGTRVAYFKSPGRALTITNINSKETQTIANWTDWWDTYPIAWGVVPEGEVTYEKIVFTDQINDSNSILWVVEPDGENLQQLLRPPEWADWSVTNPSWIKNGTQLAYVTYHIDNYSDQYLVVADIGVVNGSVFIGHETNITSLLAAQRIELPGLLSWVQWSNSGQKFSLTINDDDTGLQNVWVVDMTDADSPVMFEVINSSVSQGRRQASWSPDDSELVYWASKSGKHKSGSYKVKVLSDGTGTPKFISNAWRPNWWPGASP